MIGVRRYRWGSRTFFIGGHRSPDGERCENVLVHAYGLCKAHYLAWRYERPRWSKLIHNHEEQNDDRRVRQQRHTTETDAGQNGRQVRRDAAGIAADDGVTTISTQEADAAVQKGSRRTVHEILDQEDDRGSKLVNSYLDELDSLREKRELADGTYKDELSAEQKASILMREKLPRAADTRANAKAKYTDHLAKTHEALNNRREELRENLYSTKNPEVLTRVLLSSDEPLRHLPDAALQMRDADLTRACLVAAERREAGDVLSKIFQTYPELQSDYEEWRALPDSTVLERQVENVDTILPSATPERLTPPTRVSAY